MIGPIQETSRELNNETYSTHTHKHICHTHFLSTTLQSEWKNCFLDFSRRSIAERQVRASVMIDLFLLLMLK